MYLIAGLGNPGREYEGTRHNTGFLAVDALAARLGTGIPGRIFLGLAGRALIGSEKVILLKPQTFMNNSGESIRAAADYYHIPPEQVLVFYDDVNLDVGSVRVREKGSAGGHNGMKSIIAHLGTQDFPRIRLGIGERPAQTDLIDYVLGHFTKAEREKIDEAARDAADAAVLYLTEGASAAMNRYNHRKASHETDVSGTACGTD